MIFKNLFSSPIKRTYVRYHFLRGVFLSTSNSVSNKKDPIITRAPSPPHKNVSIGTLQAKKLKGEKISMVTAYDFPSAVHVDKAGIDVLLVGDSLGMVELGFDTTLPVDMSMMIHHCQAVTRGCHRPLIVADMPFGSFEASAELAVTNSVRLMKEGRVDCVKVEGGKDREHLVNAIVKAGVAVMGHIGLTPQAFSALGGFKAQGKTSDQALKLIDDAIAIQNAGAFAIVIECVPAIVAKMVTEHVSIPTIGIGSGKFTDGQVLVYHDLLGFMQHHHHAQFTPSFCKQYATVGYEIQNGLAQYKAEVEQNVFPDESFSPYKISQEEEAKFLKALEKRKKINNQQSLDTENIKVY